MIEAAVWFHVQMAAILDFLEAVMLFSIGVISTGRSSRAFWRCQHETVGRSACALTQTSSTPVRRMQSYARSPIYQRRSQDLWFGGVGGACAPASQAQICLPAS
ncbi:hypothetical protein [Pannonibacter carbonis]|uniref:hypothetical protein n=1 Tax=Pannonibacter carbonis TaxID=2067569 RepID=UPI00130037C0|nr:hypothetical protein [Pannonibacter carbonis]